MPQHSRLLHSGSGKRNDLTGPQKAEIAVLERGKPVSKRLEGQRHDEAEDTTPTGTVKTRFLYGCAATLALTLRRRTGYHGVLYGITARSFAAWPLWVEHMLSPVEDRNAAEISDGSAVPGRQRSSRPAAQFPEPFIQPIGAHVCCTSKRKK